MKNIHSINFIKHTTLLACSALLAVSLAACSQPAASDAASTAGSASSSATSDTAQIPNPWTGCTTLADAAALTGYDFTVPDSVDGYPDVTIAVLESEQLTEVQYSSGNARLCLRKAPGSDDISGDYNQYAESNAVDVDGRSVTLQGNDGQVQLATWLDGDYTYSIGIYRDDGTGLTAYKMTDMVKAAKLASNCNNLEQPQPKHKRVRSERFTAHPLFLLFTLFVAAVLQSVLLIRRRTRQHLTKQRCYCSTPSQSCRDVPAIKNCTKGNPRLRERRGFEKGGEEHMKKIC